MAKNLSWSIIWSATLQCASYDIVILAYNTPLLFLPGCFLQWSLFVIVQMKALCKNPLIIHRILTCMKWDMLDNLTLDYGYPWSCADDAVSEWLRAYASSQLQGRCQHQVITGLHTVFWQASIEKVRDRQVLIHAVATWSKAAAGAMDIVLHFLQEAWPQRNAIQIPWECGKVYFVNYDNHRLEEPARYLMGVSARS